MRFFAQLVLAIAALAFTAQPVLAQSILRDAETEALLNDMAAPLVEAAGLAPGNVDMVLINDPSINAFVAGGQVVYLHSGLIDAADTANEVQGVIADELGHITGGHIVRFSEGAGKASNISILSMLLGLGAALAGGGEAAMGILAAGQRAALGKFLAFSRVQDDAGISGRGSLDFFGKLYNRSVRYGYDVSDDSEFNRTHPLSQNRIARLREVYEVDPAWDTPSDPDIERRFKRVKAKLYGYLTEPKRVLQKFPASDTSVPARYARAYAYHKSAMIDEAMAETNALLAMEPNNPYFLEVQGQVLLESGKVDEALVPLRQATELSGYHPLIASIFGHALIATEDTANHPEAERILRTAVGRDRRNAFAWYQLGVVYAARGDMPRARLASAEQQVMTRRYTEALRSAQFAENGLEEGTADWLRAQDISLEARAALEQIRNR